MYMQLNAITHKENTMSLSHALLGLLKYKPNTGYNIKTAFESSINFFWNVSLPQIYRTLNSMEKQGWLESDIEHQQSKPNKKVYRLTAEGDSELQNWLSQKPGMPQPKDELLVKLFFGTFMDRKTLIDHIKYRREQALRFLENADDIIQPTAKDYARKADANDDVTFWLLTLDFGKRRSQATIEWCDDALKILEKL